MQVNILEAKNRLSQLIKSARAGEDIVIANRGEPVARLIPVDTVRQMESERGEVQGILDWLESHPLPAHARRSVEEIDASIAEERAAWD
jgi:prevent-host-death family protein